jgi:hypothetical protein
MLIQEKKDLIMDSIKSRPMWVFAEGLRWLDRWREPVSEDLLSKWPRPPEGSDEMYAMAYSRGAFDAYDLIAKRFVETSESLPIAEIWKRLDEANKEMMAPTARPEVRPKKDAP